MKSRFCTVDMAEITPFKDGSGGRRFKLIDLLNCLNDFVRLTEQTDVLNYDTNSIDVFTSLWLL